MVDIEELLEKFGKLNAQKDEIDAERAKSYFPGAKIGCCIYPESLIMQYTSLNESILENLDFSDEIADDSTRNCNLPSKKLDILTDERVIYVCEMALYVICYHLIETGNTDALLGVLVRNEVYFAILPQTKAAKMIRSVLERLSQEVKNLDVLHKIFSIYRDWCDLKKRTFLGLRLKVKIAIILILKRRFGDALVAIEKLQHEVKSIDDKPLMLDVYLVQAKLYLLLRNFAKMKIVISNAKNVATNINTPTYVTAEIDLLSGILYLCEKDYKTAYSFFYEAFEGFNMSLCNAHGFLFPNLAKIRKYPKMLANSTESSSMHFPKSSEIITSQGFGKTECHFSCHPTVSDISPVFFTLYNLYEYYTGSQKADSAPIVDSCSEHYMKYCPSIPPIIIDELKMDGNNDIIPEIYGEIVDIGMLVRADERKLVQSLKYLLVAAVLNGQAHELNTILGNKNKLKYVNHVEIVMIQKIGACYRESCLVDFETLLREYRGTIVLDPVLRQEIESLYEALLERNIIRLLKPYSSVQFSFIAEKLKLPQHRVEKKLAEMILDDKLKGTIDQGMSRLEIFDEVVVQPIYEDVAKTIAYMTEVIDTLYEKAQCAI